MNELQKYVCEQNDIDLKDITRESFDELSLFFPKNPFGSSQEKGSNLLFILERMLNEKGTSPTPHDFMIREIILSFAMLQSSLMDRMALVDAPLKIRIYFENIKKFYKINKQHLAFSKKVLKAINFCGAECHLGSLLNKNISKEFTRQRDQFTLNIFKDNQNEIFKLFADVFIKKAIIDDSNTLMYSIFVIEDLQNIFLEIIEEAQNEIFRLG